MEQLRSLVYLEWEQIGWLEHMAVSNFIHPLALFESDSVGAGTRIWAFAHVMKGAKVGTDCNIGEAVFVESGAIVGNRVTLKNQVMVWDGVVIEDDVFIGPGVVFTNDKVPRSPRMAEVAERYRKAENWRLTTVVRQGASVGAAAVVLPGLTIGKFAMIGAAAVVTRDVPAHMLVLGNPARPAGWVCKCGGRLNAELACPHCNSSYSLS
ncbi:MAG TPA: acyltransferase, partial [Gemmataceae bacterium]|nr:acyltransferase [Gemmataceae bacterium]